ncbi:MAG: glycosyltransferase family 39 protein [Candidatus Solibacter sp.]
MAAIKSSRTAPRSSALLVFAALFLVSGAALAIFYSNGWLLYYGDAEAHLNIARRMVDSRTPGYDQVGTVWLPLPHWLMLPFVRNDAMWWSGVAGAIPSMLAFLAAGMFLFGAAHRIFDSVAAGATAAALFALNPNVLYLQSIPMTESLFAACLLGLLYFSVRFHDTQGWGAVAGAGIAACAGTLTRYEGWFVLPFAALYFLLTAKRKRFTVAIAFSLIAALGPLFWFFHNWWLTMDPLAFYRGPYSARAIQGNAPYPGRGDWREAFLYYRTAAQLCAGPCLPVMAIAGAVAALFRRAFWPLLLLALPGAFFVWSLHSSGTPIFLPILKPFSYYNSRYGLAVMPLFAFAGAALVAIAPAVLRGPLAAVAVLAAAVPWVIHPSPSTWVTWEESRVNSEARREWTRQAADYLRPRYIPGTGILTGFGDLSGIYRTLHIPLRDTFTPDNGLPFDAAVIRPELFLREPWVVTMGGAPAQSAVNRAARLGIVYSLEKTVIVPYAPVIEIYRR